MRLLPFVVLSCLLAGCRSPIASDPGQDAREWQGTWKLISSTYDGEPQMADMQSIVDGDHYNVRLNQHLGEYPYNIKLDAGQKHIDVFHHETPRGPWVGA
jgi:hypothetical protein